MRDFLGLQEECKVYEPSDKIIISENVKLFDEKDDRIIVMTYAKAGMLLKFHPHIFDAIEVMICDEIHRVPEFI